MVKAGGPTLVRPGFSADVYSGKAVMMKLMGMARRWRVVLRQSFSQMLATGESLEW